MVILKQVEFQIDLSKNIIYYGLETPLILVKLNSRLEFFV